MDMTFKASLRSEFLKTKRTPLLYLVLVAAFFVPFVLVFDHHPAGPGISMNGWDHFYKEGFAVFVFVFLPFFFILTSTLLLQIEIRNQSWKQVLASPQPFFYILLAKYTVLQTLAVVFLVVFNVYMAMGCALIDMIYGGNLLAYLKRWPELLKLTTLAWGATLGISTLSFWLALRFNNFVTPIGVGLLLWLIGPTAAMELKWRYFDAYVFVLPFTILSNKFEHGVWFYQLLSMGYALLFFGAAYVEFVLQRISYRARGRIDKT